ncbi:MAG: response regulator [Thermodesulfobacteriota bacterium]
MNRRILLVDDEELTCRTIARILETEPYELFFARNGQEGLELFREVWPALLLLDLQMPILDGLSVIRELAPTPTDPYAVVVLTGHGDDQNARACFEAGVTAFLHKPVHPHELRGLVRNLLALKEAEKELFRQRDELASRATELAEERSRLCAITAAARDGIVLADPRGRITFWNPAAESIFRRPAAEVLGLPLTDLFPAGNGDAAPIPGSTTELVIDCPDGQTVPVESSWASVAIRGQNHTLAVTRDISSRKRLEEKMLAVREREMRQAMLVHGGRLTALGEMAAAMAHEINQPLSVISVTLQRWQILAGRGCLDQGQMMAEVGQLRRNVQRLSDIIDHVRLLSRSEGQESATVDLNGVVHQALSLCSTQLRVRGIEVAQDLAPCLPPVSAVAQELEQVVINLLSNARHALEDRLRSQPQHPARIAIRSSSRGAAVALQVEDNGGGVPAAFAERIFEPFFTTKPCERGTGLGLHIAATIMAKHGGRISLHNEPGQGACFELVLPAAG